MTSEAATSTRGEISEADVEQYMTSLSNWGRWGEDDQLGTLNLITDEARLAAAQTIKAGRAVSLSRDIDPLNADTLGSGLSLVQRFMGLHEAGDHLEGESVRFDAVTEYVGISAHGSSTHVDGLAHYSWDGKTYNGFPESDTTSGIEYVTPNAAWESNLDATGSRIIPVGGDRAALVSTLMRLLAESSGRPMPATAIA